MNDRGFTRFEMGCMAYHNQAWPKLQSVAHTARDLNVSIAFLDQQIWAYRKIATPKRS